MKHISKKFLNQRLLNEDEKKMLSDNAISYNNQIKDLKFNKNSQIPFIITENDYIIQAFEFKKDNQKRFLPEPDQVLIYFNNAYNSFKQIEPIKKVLLEKTLPDSAINEGVENEVYNLFGHTSGFVIFLFSAIEAFMNRMIPDNYIYSEKENRRTSTYDKNQIQKYLSFETKYSKVIPDISEFDFRKQFPTKHTILWNLKEFRDELIHPKQSKGINSYEQISKKALNFKYEKTLEVVRDYLNYYKPNFIEECTCGIDY